MAIFAWNGRGIDIGIGKDGIGGLILLFSNSLLCRSKFQQLS
jgi:hypothetical protein